jgi:uncharacterized membrane protein
MAIELLILRLIHILCGIFWVGSGLFTALFLFPAMATPGIQPGPVINALRQRGLMTALPVAALLTIGSGLRLMWLTSAGFSGAWFSTAPGHAYASAGAAAIIAFLVSLLVARPAAIKSAQLGGSLASAPSDQRATLGAELAKLRRRNAVSSTVVITLLVLAAAGMSVARYLT